MTIASTAAWTAKWGIIAGATMVGVGVIFAPAAAGITVGGIGSAALTGTQLTASATANVAGWAGNELAALAGTAPAIA